jgi:dynein heavy chain
LKRHFSIFNCTVPTDASLDKIYSTIGSCHYNVKRGFSEPVRLIIQKLVQLTRVLWKSTRMTLLPTPAKFHYIFNLRDLSRIWQGMIGTLSTVIDSEKSTVKLWIHECTRVLTDRFTDPQDKVWFDEETQKLTEEHLGKEFVKTVKSEAVFVDFMRDAPEPTMSQLKTWTFLKKGSSCSLANTMKLSEALQ